MATVVWLKEARAWNALPLPLRQSGCQRSFAVLYYKVLRRSPESGVPFCARIRCSEFSTLCTEKWAALLSSFTTLGNWVRIGRALSLSRVSTTQEESSK